MGAPVAEHKGRYIVGYVLGGLAIIAGIALEILGYGAAVEGLIIGFAFFILTQVNRMEDRIGGRLDKVVERLDRIVGALEG